MKIQLSVSYLTYRHLNNYGKIVVMVWYYPPFIRAIHKYNTKAILWQKYNQDASKTDMGGEKMKRED